jgi:hypothetical protein
MAFRYDLGKKRPVGQPNLTVRVLSRIFDEPRAALGFHRATERGVVARAHHFEFGILSFDA